ncbi:hypothetical protein GA0115240_139218 [Streptomyces sp. DvalAA-14]|nr:hypothetical protein GA0115240_139218 [Streptomyces sp. DvalAA-14]
MPGDPSAAWWDAQLSPERRALDFIDFAVDQVEQLAPMLPEGAGLDDVVRAACMESFWVNVRLLAEFLARDPNPRDWNARDFVPEWGSANTETAARLNQAWTLASRHVMHLSKERTPNLGDVSMVTAQQIEQIAQDCRLVYNELRAQLPG